VDLERGERRSASQGELTAEELARRMEHQAEEEFRLRHLREWDIDDGLKRGGSLDPERNRSTERDRDWEVDEVEDKSRPERERSRGGERSVEERGRVLDLGKEKVLEKKDGKRESRERSGKRESAERERMSRDRSQEEEEKIISKNKKTKKVKKKKGKLRDLEKSLLTTPLKVGG